MTKEPIIAETSPVADDIARDRTYDCVAAR
jgi:hypothetical protein